MALADFDPKVSAFLWISCASLRFSTIDISQLLHGSDRAGIVSSWRQIRATISMYGPDASAAGGPGSIRVVVCGLSLSPSRFRWPSEGPVGTLGGLDADRLAAKGAEGKGTVGSTREVAARSSSLHSFVMVIRVVGNGIRTGASAHVVLPSRLGSSSLTPRDGREHCMVRQGPRRRARQ